MNGQSTTASEATEPLLISKHSRCHIPKHLIDTYLFENLIKYCTRNIFVKFCKKTIVCWCIPATSNFLVDKQPIRLQKHGLKIATYRKLQTPLVWWRCFIRIILWCQRRFIFFCLHYQPPAWTITYKCQRDRTKPFIPKISKIGR